MDAAGEDRLSTLPDDLLRRILYFVPFKEAASTSVLSRRYGTIWRSSGAVNLSVRVTADICNSPTPDAFSSRRAAFVRAANAALAAAAGGGSRVTRLTFHVEADRDDGWIGPFLSYYANGVGRQREVVGDVLSHPAAHRVEELHVAAVEPADQRSTNGEVKAREYYKLYYSISSLPSASTLRLLDLTNCHAITLPEAAAFPRLATLRLRLCEVKLKELQRILGSAPGLATVHLTSVFLLGTGKEERLVRLRFPAATTLILAKCSADSFNKRMIGCIEIDAPMLQSFLYVGISRQFSLISPAPDLASVDLHFLHNVHHFDVDTTRVRFWKFVHNFTNAKVLKLKVRFLSNIADVNKVTVSRATELPCAFPNVRRLELEGVLSSKKMAKENAPVAIAIMLDCCPVLHDLTLKLIKRRPLPPCTTYSRSIFRMGDQLDFDKFIHRLVCARESKAKMISLYNDRLADGEVLDIPAMS